MKKLILASLIFMATGSLFAQAPAMATKKISATQKTTLNAVPAKTTTTVTKAAVVKPMTPLAKTVKPVAAKTKVTTTSTAKTSGVVLKKDGTPDKRYKTTTAPLKKDGTPDMRYKQNKKS